MQRCGTQCTAELSVGGLLTGRGGFGGEAKEIEAEDLVVSTAQAEREHRLADKVDGEAVRRSGRCEWDWPACDLPMRPPAGASARQLCVSSRYLVEIRKGNNIAFLYGSFRVVADKRLFLDEVPPAMVLSETWSWRGSGCEL